MKEKIIEIMYMVEKMPPSKLETDIIVKLMELKDIFSIDSTTVITHNGKEVSEELKTILKLSTDVMFLKDENETLNKGIDELIEKSKRLLNIYNSVLYADEDWYDDNIRANVYKEILQDLKSLKGE